MAYITVIDADLINDSSEWIALTEEQKEYALDIGQKWIDENYTCSIESPVQAEIQRANAYLGDFYAQGTLFTPESASVTASTVKAGSVSVSEEYGVSERVEDPFSEINLLLNSTTCKAQSSMTVIRG